MRIVRILLGVVFVGSGLMKVFVPRLGDAFSAQLAALRKPENTTPNSPMYSHPPQGIVFLPTDADATPLIH